MSERYLIAGGSGLVGTHLSQALQKRGVDFLSTYYTRKPKLPAQCYRQFDFTKFSDCLDATKGRQIVFICAAQTFGAKKMKENPAVIPNLQIFSGLLEASRLNGAKKVILISSSTVYQDARFPIHEDQLDLNLSPYPIYFGTGWLFRFVEKLAVFYHRTYGMEIGVLRATNIYGPYDHFDSASHVLPALIKRALQKENPYVVWGDETATRDFLYVEDFTDILLKLVEQKLDAAPINVGSGEATTIGMAATHILRICNHPVKPQFDSSKSVGIPYRAVNVERLRSKIKNHSKTSLEEGLKKTIEWYKREYSKCPEA
jgi:GDP-L-fucose synthase